MANLFNKKPSLRKKRSMRSSNAMASRMQPRWQQNSLSGMRTRPGTVRANPGEYRRKKFSQQRREEMVKRSVGYLKIAGVAALLGFGVMQSWVSRVRVVSTNSSQTDIVSIEATANDYLGGGFLRRSKLFLDQSELAKTVNEKHPSLDAVTVDSTLFGRSITVSVSPKQAMFRFQTQQPIKDSDTLWLSQDGILVSAASGVNETVTVVDSSDIAYELGEQVIASTQIRYISDLATKLTGEGFELTSVELTDAPKHLRLRIRDKSFYILVSTERSLTGTIRDLKRVVSYIDKSGVGVKEYIDVRVKNKVFYK